MSNHEAAINLDIAAYLEPVKVEFRNLSYSIKSEKGRAEQHILKNLSGRFVAGQLIAILGPSGAGKSTLLNVLSGFKTSGLTGTILYNDSLLDETTRKKCSYIVQDSEMLGNLTVLETMNVAMYLKRGRRLPCNVRLKIINDLMQTLNLNKCIHTRVKSLSGGEAKRLSIAVEMTTNPPVMYFDEPTSGLDSSASLQVMTLLCDLAKTGRTIVCTIHQPSSRLLELIDNVYLISNGQCLYSGALAQMVHHFEQANYHCPPQYNRADFALEVASNERYGDYEKLLMASDSPSCELEDKPLKKDEVVVVAMNGTANGETQPMIVNMDNGAVGRDKVRPRKLNRSYNVNFYDQVMILCDRSVRHAFRSLVYCHLRVFATAIVAMLLGSIFWQIGLHADHMLTNAACLYFFMLFILFANAMSTVVTFPIERRVFMREHLNNWYSIAAYVIAKIAAGLPVQILCPTIFLSIAYFMTGQPLDVSRFVLLWIILSLIAIMADSLGLLVGAICDIQLGTFVVCAIFIPNLLFSGFFIKYSELPVAYQPFYQMSFLRFGFEGSLNAIYGFERSTLICQGMMCLITKPAKFLKILEMDGGLYMLDVIGLCVWTVSLWFLLYLTVYVRLKRAQ